VNTASDEFWRGVVFKFYPKGWVYQEQIVFNRLYESLTKQYLKFEGGIIAPSQVAGYDHELRQRLLGEPFWKAVLNHHQLAGMRLPSFGKVFQKTANSQTVNNLALLACALERHLLAQGGYPETLDALAPAFIKKVPRDVVNGKPLVYRKKADGTFLLYSVGWNDKDDGGLLLVRESGNVNQDEGDWVWQYTTPRIRVADKR
jgi:hypothetical protein